MSFLFFFLLWEALAQWFLSFRFVMPLLPQEIVSALTLHATRTKSPAKFAASSCELPTWQTISRNTVKELITTVAFATKVIPSKNKTALYSGSKSETFLPPILINIQRVLTSWMFTIYRLILFDILVNVLLGKIRHESRVMVDVLPCDLVIFKSKILII